MNATPSLRSTQDLTDLDASDLSAAIHARAVSCAEVMQAYLQRIHRLNPACNALVNLAADDVLMAQARACDDELAQGRSRGWLHGIPQAIKDTGAAAGFPTTVAPIIQSGFVPVFIDNDPITLNARVEQLEEAYRDGVTKAV